MRIGIFGLGYVGAVSAACLARDGHTVIGVDPNEAKVDLIRRGQTPIIEKDMAELTAAGVEAGRLTATTNAAEAVANTDMSLVCVGTPSNANGNLDYRYIRSVCNDIGQALRSVDVRHTVVIRSTILPGSMHGTVIPLLEEASGKRAGRDFGVCNNPEFLREGAAVYDYDNPQRTVIGESDPESGALVASVYEHLPAPVLRTSHEVAEMVKYIDNTWHATKVAFGNEVGSICKALGIDSHEVMDIFCQDEKLNISRAYLMPGFAFGGSCLPKDVRALTYRSKHLDLDLPLIHSVLGSNEQHLRRCIQMVTSLGRKKIGVLGLSFKAGTDDLRESPMVAMVEYLVGKGYEIKIYDANVHLARIVGANREYILNALPHLSKLLVETMDEVLDHAETVIVGNNAEEFRGIGDRLGADQSLIDYVRVLAEMRGDQRYHGVCW